MGLVPSLTSCPAAVLGHPWSVSYSVEAQRPVYLGVSISRARQTGLKLCIGLSEQKTAASYKCEAMGPTRRCYKLRLEA